MQDLHDALAWRYATKQYDVSKKLTDAQLEMVLEAARMAPTSFGLQPFRMFVVTNPEIRAQLREAAWGQSAITDASHLIVFAAQKNLDASSVDAFINMVAQERGVTPADLKGYADMIKGSVASRGADQNTAWAARQAYIALGFLLEAAALAHIDATPMEGFTPERFDEVLGLSAQGYTSVVLAAVGFRSESDTYAAMKKVRFAKEEMIRTVR